MFMEPNQRDTSGQPFSCTISSSSPADFSFPCGEQGRLQRQAPPSRAPTMSGELSGFEIKVSCSPNSKENMASWKDVLRKKEEKIVPPSWGLCHSAVLVSAIIQMLSTYI